MDNIVYKYGDYQKKCIVRNSSRKTLGITVTPQMDILLQAPYNCCVKRIQDALFKRRIWIKKQLQEFEKFHPMQTPRKYVSGETHMYLGRQYRLKVKKNEDTPVKLKGGYFYVGADAPEIAKQKMEQWYSQKADKKLVERLELCLKRVPNTNIPNVNIRKMEKRWGSVSKNGTLTLNTNLVKAPVDCIDYVIIHELCHQKYMNHSKDFWELLDSVYPNWQKTKHKMEVMLS